jgi:hypothetical protein
LKHGTWQGDLLASGLKEIHEVLDRNTDIFLPQTIPQPGLVLLTG